MARRCACAAVLLESVCGASGAARGGGGARSAACDEFGVALIARDGAGWAGRAAAAALAWGVAPHVLSVGGALGGGYCAVAAVV